MQSQNGKLNASLEKNATIDDAIDIFKKNSKKKIRESEWDYRFPNPPDAQDYLHACRIPKSVYEKERVNFRGSISPISFGYAVMNKTAPQLKAIKQKYCLPNITRMKEPDMICVGFKEHSYSNPECRFIQNNDPETTAELGSAFAWVHPTTYTKEKMLIGTWKRIIYPEEMKKKAELDYKFVA